MSKYESNKKWREKNKDRLRVSAKKWGEEHPGYYNKKAKEYYWRHRESIRGKKRENPGVLYGTIKRNARTRNLPLTISKEDFITWYTNSEKVCCYCDIPVSRLSVTDMRKKLSKRLSVDRKNNEEGYTCDNISLACLQCNFIKSNLFTFQEMREIAQKYIKPKWQ